MIDIFGSIETDVSFNYFQNNNNNNNNNYSNDNNEEVVLIENLDILGRQNNLRKEQQLRNGEWIREREEKLLKHIQYLGVNRQGMPKKREKSKL
jgi:hypothetical protein